MKAKKTTRDGGWAQGTCRVEDAERQYAEAAQDIRDMLRSITEGLAAHKAAQKTWGHVGDLNEVRLQLRRVEAFIGGEPGNV